MKQLCGKKMRGTAELRVFARTYLYMESKLGLEGNEDLRVSDSENVVKSTVPIEVGIRDCFVPFFWNQTG